MASLLRDNISKNIVIIISILLLGCFLKKNSYTSCDSYLHVGQIYLDSFIKFNDTTYLYRALAQFKSGEKCDSTNSEFVLNQGTVYGHLGNYKELLNVNSFFLKNSDEKQFFYLQRGLIFHKLNLNDSVTANLEKSKKIFYDKKNKRVSIIELNLFIQVMLLLNDKDELEGALNEISKKNPNLNVDSLLESFNKIPRENLFDR